MFEVVPDKIYQVRGYDLANVTFIKGNTGWIVMDTATSPECAKAALDLANQKLGARPVLAVIHSHSHVDHYGGVRGIVDRADVDSGKVKVIAPQDFVQYAVSENVIAGNAMSRRAVYMYGALLPRNPEGGVSAGLGMTVPAGVPTRRGNSSHGPTCQTTSPSKPWTPPRPPTSTNWSSQKASPNRRRQRPPAS